MTAANHLKDIFDADRALRKAEKDLLKVPDAGLSELLWTAVVEAKGLTERDEQEATMRLQRLADLCAQVPGPQMADALIQILDSDIPSIRVSTAEALVDVAFDRYAEVARAVDRVLQKQHSGPAMGELPWVIAEIAEPSAVGLIGRFLKLSDPAIVASAAEALAALDDPSAIPLLEPLVNDQRPVELDEYEGEVTAVLGDLVREVINALSGEDDDDDDDDLDEN